MKRIGNNEFFEDLNVAKRTGTRRGYSDGAKIVSTEAGFCLLDLGECADDRSYKYLIAGTTVATKNGGRWRNV